MKVPIPPACANALAGSLPPRPSGYFLFGKWHSSHCNAKVFDSRSDQAECLKNKVVHILGDSTIRQWYSYYVNFMSVGRLKYLRRLGQNQVAPVETKSIKDIWEPRTAIDERNNIVFHFSAHGPPLQNGGAPKSQPYIADQIDDIKGGENTVVAITIGNHLLLYEPSVFIQRLENIKQAVLRLLKRSPETLIVFKGMNIFVMDDFDTNQCCLSDWLAYRLDTIARNILKDIKGVTYLDMWELSGSHSSTPGGLHTQAEVVHNEVSLFLSFVCPEMT